jgi:two-component system chemotaxis response regulator CheY
MLNILVVDDSLIIRKTLVEEFQKMGHKVVAEAKGGREAMELYELFKPDLVTMDITMPVMNGIAAVKEIKRFHSDAKIVMITSHGEEKMVMQAIKNGARGYILKPITKDKLDEVISKVFSAEEEEE